MERLGKSFILVLEPLEFNIYERKMNYDTLGFVFGTQSTWLRNQMYHLVTEYLKYWQRYFTPKAIKEIRDNISNFITSKVKREEVMFRDIFQVLNRIKSKGVKAFDRIEYPHQVFFFHDSKNYFNRPPHALSANTCHPVSLGTKNAYQLCRIFLCHNTNHQVAHQELSLERNPHKIAHSKPGRIRDIRGDVIEVFPAYEEDRAIRIELFGDTVDAIRIIDPLRGKVLENLDEITIFASSHFVTSKERLQIASGTIKEELKERLAFFEAERRLVEAQRLFAEHRFYSCRPPR